MKKFADGVYVRSKLKSREGQRGRVYAAGAIMHRYTVGPDETLVLWLIETPSDGDWAGDVEVVKTRNLVEIRKVVTVTWVDVKR